MHPANRDRLYGKLTHKTEQRLELLFHQIGPTIASSISKTISKIYWTQTKP